MACCFIKLTSLLISVRFRHNHLQDLVWLPIFMDVYQLKSYQVWKEGLSVVNSVIPLPFHSLFSVISSLLLSDVLLFLVVTDFRKTEVALWFPSECELAPATKHVLVLLNLKIAQSTGYLKYWSLAIWLHGSSFTDGIRLCLFWYKQRYYFPEANQTGSPFAYFKPFKPICCKTRG